MFNRFKFNSFNHMEQPKDPSEILFDVWDEKNDAMKENQTEIARKSTENALKLNSIVDRQNILLGKMLELAIINSGLKQSPDYDKETVKKNDLEFEHTAREIDDLHEKKIRAIEEREELEEEFQKLRERIDRLKNQIFPSAEEINHN